jgi:hypothetical protein
MDRMEDSGSSDIGSIPIGATDIKRTPPTFSFFIAYNLVYRNFMESKPGFSPALKALSFAHAHFVI